MKNEPENPIIIYDGVCNLCNGTVFFLIRLDKKRIFRYSHLQSDSGQRYLNLFNFSSLENDSVILFLENKILFKSDAVLEIMKILGGGWKLFYLLKIIPLKLRDLLYDYVARNRYKWFGRKEACVIPGKEFKDLFLD